MAKTGLSKGVKITFGGSRLHGKTKTKNTTANKTLAQIEKERARHAYEISGQSLSPFLFASILNVQSSPELE
jgi:hypothetical protein